MTKLQIAGIIIAAVCLAAPMIGAIRSFHHPEDTLNEIRKMTPTRAMRNVARSFILNLLVVGGILLILLGGS